MTHEKYPHEALRQFHESTADRAGIWIDDGSGRIIDELEVQTRIRPVRFGEGDLVLRAGTEEIYRILEARLTGLAAAGNQIPAYRCQRVEVRESSGEILPACLGLEFEFTDFELQPIPPRYPIAPSRRADTRVTGHPVVDLVGPSSPARAIEQVPSGKGAPRISAERRLLLPGKAGGP